MLPSGAAILLIAVALLAYFVEDYTTLLEAQIRDLGSWAPVCFIVGAGCFVLFLFRKVCYPSLAGFSSDMARIAVRFFPNVFLG